jgi:hypothetical protein
MRADDSSKGKRLIEKLHECKSLPPTSRRHYNNISIDETDMYDQRYQVVGADHLEPFPYADEDEDNNIAGYVQQKCDYRLECHDSPSLTHYRCNAHAFKLNGQSILLQKWSPLL